MYKLIIGNMNYSSWSLRAWLYMKSSGLSFNTIRIPLFTDGWKDQLRDYSDASRVPVLIDQDTGRTIWDSLAIIEYLRESHTDALDYPLESSKRAHARSMVAEMHSGFLAIRGELPMNLKQRIQLDCDSLSSDCIDQIQRIEKLWTNCLQTQSAPAFLFGKLSIADIFFAPVVTRFASYGITVSNIVTDYMNRILELEAMREWHQAALSETECIAFVDNLVSVDDTPL